MYNELTNEIADLQYFFSRVKDKEPERPPFRSERVLRQLGQKAVGFQCLALF